MKFAYRGLDRNNEPVSGKTVAEEAEAATTLLAEEGIHATSVKPVRHVFPQLRPVGGNDIAALCEQLAGLAEAGVPMNEAMAALARDASHPRLREALLRIDERLRSGRSLEESLEEEESVVPPLVPALIRAGGSSGNLPEVLRLAAAHTSRMHDLRMRVLYAMAYPVTALVFFLVVLTIAAEYIIPQFDLLYRDMNIALPVLTVAILEFAAYYRYILAAILGVMLVLMLVMWLPGLSPRCVPCSKWMLHNLPLIGPIFRSSYLYRFCRFLSLLVMVGTPLDEALALLAQLDRRMLTPGASESLVQGVREGRSLYQVMMVRLHMFPELLVWTVQNCERHGRLAAGLAEMADLYERETDRESRAFDSILPPLILIFVGLLIGGGVIGLFLPLVSIITELGG